MLDRVTPRQNLRDELITITRMLLGMPPAVKGDLPAPEAPDTASQTGGSGDKSAEKPAKK